MKKLIIVLLSVIVLFLTNCKKDDLTERYNDCINQRELALDDAKRLYDNKQISLSEYERRYKEAEHNYQDCLNEK